MSLKSRTDLCLFWVLNRSLHTVLTIVRTPSSGTPNIFYVKSSQHTKDGDNSEDSVRNKAARLKVETFIHERLNHIFVYMETQETDKVHNKKNF